MKLNKNEKQLLQIERACSDLRRGMYVLVYTKNSATYIYSPDNHYFIGNLFKKPGRLIISSTRLGYLFPDNKITEPMAVQTKDLSWQEIDSICLDIKPVAHLEYSDLLKTTKIEQYALKLAKIAELAPAIISCSAEENSCDDCVTKLDGTLINSYIDAVYYNLQEACRTKLNLANAKNAEIIAYRPSIGGQEHYAIIIGTINKEPLVRIHSSCYTGDLLASLDCDCQSQLQSAVSLMAENGGGIILYLMQEGRGIGLVNKLRAYNLKNLGLDTVVANQALGFDDDERLFLPAAEILKKLGINKVQLLTNNPKKAKSLQDYNIIVTKIVPHVMETNEFNKNYLQTKVDKMGHQILLDK